MFFNLAGTPGSIVFQDSAGFFPVSLNDHENSYLNSSQRLDNILVTTYPGQNLGIADDNDAVPKLKRHFQLATSHREHSRPMKSSLFRIQLKSSFFRIQLKSSFFRIQLKSSLFSHTIEVKSFSHTIEVKSFSHTTEVKFFSHTIEVKFFSHTIEVKSFSHTTEVKSFSHTIIHNKQSYLALVKATFKRLGSFRKPMPCKILKRNRAIEIIIIIIVIIIIINKVN